MSAVNEQGEGEFLIIFSVLLLLFLCPIKTGTIYSSFWAGGQAAQAKGNDAQTEKLFYSWTKEKIHNEKKA